MIVIHYIRQLCLEGYEERHDAITLRCPYCGDSQKNRRKKRGYILNISSNPYFFCHNCDITKHIEQFIKDQDYSIYSDYMDEKRKYDVQNFKLKKEPQNIVITSIKEKQEYNNVFSKYLYTIEECKAENEVKQYLKKRRIPEKHFNKIYYFNGNIYKLFGKIFNSDKWKEKEDNKYIQSKGVVVPFINRFNENIGLGFRMINNKNRFINLFNDYKDQFFLGEEKCDFNKPVYVVEGMLDKLTFRDDSQVLCMTSANSRLNYVKQLTDNKVTYIFDYEYMNKQIYKRSEDAIKEGHNLFLWNSNMYKGKDINDLKKDHDKTDQEILDIIQQNTYNGFTASMMLKKRYNELSESLSWR